MRLASNSEPRWRGYWVNCSPNRPVSCLVSCGPGSLLRNLVRCCPGNLDGSCPGCFPRSSAGCPARCSTCCPARRSVRCGPKRCPQCRPRSPDSRLPRCPDNRCPDSLPNFLPHCCLECHPGCWYSQPARARAGFQACRESGLPCDDFLANSLRLSFGGIRLSEDVSCRLPALG